MDFFNNFFQGQSQFQNAQNNNKPVNNDKLYNILGVSKNASDKEIRKSYLKKSINGEYRHPDKGGSPEKFKQLSQAYEVLKDPKKKENYNKFGEVSLKGEFQQNNGNNPFDLQSMFMNQNARQQQQRHKIIKGSPTTFNLKLSLEELCLNTTKKIKITRRVVFDVFNNCKLEDHDLEKSWGTCDKCDGKGAIIQVRQVGPGFIQQSQSPCNKCKGSGYTLKNEYQIREMEEIISIHIDKGSTNGTKIKFENKGNVTPGKMPGDLIIIINEKKHSLFTRKENDLLIKKKISIQEALCGVQFYLKHPDGRILDINSDKTIISNSENIKCIKDAGMPIPNDSFTNGRLFIYFIIEFPGIFELNNNAKNDIKNIFENLTKYNDRIHSKNYNPTKEEEELIEPYTIETVDMSEFGIKRKEYKNANESDSDDENIFHGHQQQQCRQM